MRKSNFIIVLLLIINISFVLAGIKLIDKINAIEEKMVVSVISIIPTSNTDEKTIYTIYYSDGTTSSLEVKNGKDGEDAQNLTILDMYEAYVEKYGEISYSDFINQCFDLELDTIDTYTYINECLQSVGKIYCEFEEASYNRYPGGQTTTTINTVVSTGACVIYKIDSEYTYFITNYHVVHNSDAYQHPISQNMYIYLYGSESHPVKLEDKTYDYGESSIYCEYVGGAITYDIALVKAKTEDVLAINENVKEIEFAESYYVGEDAIAIGNPNDGGISVTKGIVSVDNEYITLSIDGTARNYRSIRIDTALYSGNSGGGLFNELGQLIGIANAGDSTDQNINFAVPVDIVKAVCENVLYYQNDNDDTTNGVNKILLGVTVSSQNSKYIYDAELGHGKIVEEILINEISANSIAENLGLQSGDIIKGFVINGEEVMFDRYYQMGDYILYLTSQTTISIIYYRDNVYTTSSYVITTNDVLNVA